MKTKICAILMFSFLSSAALPNDDGDTCACISNTVSCPAAGAMAIGAITFLCSMLAGMKPVCPEGEDVWCCNQEKKGCVDIFGNRTCTSQESDFLYCGYPNQSSTEFHPAKTKLVALPWFIAGASLFGIGCIAAIINMSVKRCYLYSAEEVPLQL